jgi:hypothetical protein
MQIFEITQRQPVNEINYGATTAARAAVSAAVWLEVLPLALVLLVHWAMPLPMRHSKHWVLELVQINTRS